jgi:cbb3-type cytochrome oxidase cytochrome c subunit
MDEYGTLSHDAAEAKKDFSFAETELRDFRGDYQAEKFQFEERKREALVLWGDTAEGWAEVARIAREFEETYDRDLEKLAAKVERLDIEANDRAKQLAAYVAAHAAATNGKTLTDLEGRLSEIEQGTTEIAKQIAALEANWRQALRNAPVLDALAPSYKIEKVVTPDLHEDLNFLTVPRIDRCKTCHINIDDPTPEYASLPPDADWGTVYRSHPRLDLFLGSASPHPYETFGCTVCHNGDGHATDFTRAAHTPRDDEQKHHWEEKYDWHKLKYQDFPMPPRKYIYFSCLKCHPHDHALDGGGQYNRGYELVQKYGCFGCHKIDAFEGAEKVGPSLTHIADKVDAAFLYKWIRNPRHFRNSTRMPRFFDLTNSVGSMDIQGPREGEIVSMDFAARNGIEALALATYLHEKSDRRSDLVRLEATGDPARGRELFRQTGCLGCHSIKRESQASAGPSATMAGPEDLGALTRSALAALGSGEPTAAPSPAVEAVREALVALERWFDRLPVADRLEERYHELAAAIEKLEKDTASGVPAETAAPAGVHPPSLQAAKAAASGFYNRWVHETFAPDLSSIGSKVTNPDWLADWILDPRRHDPKTVMPRFRLQADADGKQKIADLVAYLLSLRDPEFDGSEVFAVDEAGEAEILDAMVFDYKRRDVGREMARQEIERLTAGGAAGLNHKLVYLGHRLIRRYGCFGCHNGIKDIDSKVPGATFDAAMPIGTELNEWGIKEVKKLDYGNWGHQHDGTYAIAQTRHAWAEAKLTNTRRFDVLPTKKYAGEEGGEYWPTNRLVQKTPEELLKMPLFGFAEEREEVEAVVTFLLSLARKDEVPLGKIHRLDEEKKALETGSRLIAKFNCKGCHRIGAEKQTVPIERLPHFSLTDEGEEIGRRNNLEQETWLARPAKLRGGTRPGDPKKLGLDVRPGTLISKQVFDASTMEEGKDEPVSLVELAERDFALRGVAERDRVLRVAGYEEGQMRFYFGISPDSRFQAPPPLVREGERVRGDWLLRFLTNVTTIRPWLKVRMPSFHLTQDEARAIVRWFKTSAGVPFGGELFSEDLHDHELARRGADVFGPPVAGRTDRLQCNSCHPSGEVLPTLPVLTPPAGKETDPAWTFGWRAFPFAVPEESYYVVWKGPAGFEHQAGFPGRDEARAWGESKLAGGGTPWAVGDPWSKATWGPDLGLAAERLRPGWIRLWLRNPPDFMPGTKMPNFFGGEDPISGHPLDRTGATDQEKSAIAEGRRRIEALIQYLVHMKVVDGLAQK